MTYKVEPTNEAGQSLLVSLEKRPNSNVLPMVSVQLPTEVAIELANAANKAPGLIDTLKKIQNLVDNPHWTNDRKYRIRDLAYSAWKNF